MCTSVPQMPAASTLINISPGAGRAGGGTSRISRPGAAFTFCTACMTSSEEGRGSLGLHVRRLDDSRPDFGLLLHESRELLRRPAARLGPDFGKLVPQVFG